MRLRMPAIARDGIAGSRDRVSSESWVVGLAEDLDVGRKPGLLGMAPWKRNSRCSSEGDPPGWTLIPCEPHGGKNAKPMVRRGVPVVYRAAALLIASSGKAPRRASSSQHPPPRCRQHVGRHPLGGAAGVEQEPRARLLAVLLPERAQVRGVGEARPGAGLHFDGKQLAAGLDHEVHLLTARRAPVADLRAIEA